MARRPERRKDDVLTRDELTELQQRLSHLSEPAVEDFYRSAHHRWAQFWAHWEIAEHQGREGIPPNHMIMHEKAW